MQTHDHNYSISPQEISIKLDQLENLLCSENETLIDPFIDGYSITTSSSTNDQTPSYSCSKEHPTICGSSGENSGLYNTYTTYYNN